MAFCCHLNNDEGNLTFEKSLACFTVLLSRSIVSGDLPAGMAQRDVAALVIVSAALSSAVCQAHEGMMISCLIFKLLE